MESKIRICTRKGPGLGPSEASVADRIGCGEFRLFYFYFVLFLLVSWLVGLLGFCFVFGWLF